VTSGACAQRWRRFLFSFRKQHMRLLDSIDKYFSACECIFIGGVILFTSMLLFVNVIMRYIFHNAIYWSEELVRYTMVWLIFLGGSQVAKNEGHIAVDVVLRALPLSGRKFMNCLLDCVGIAFCLILAYFSYIQTERVYLSRQVSPAMEMPMWIAYAAIPVGGLFMAIRYVQALLSRLFSGIHEERRETGMS
jgi:C4-dicarboxylate transporter DctQ subunit